MPTDILESTAQTSGRTAIPWQPELLARYDIRGPRYTSYPGAQMFNQDFLVSDYEESLKRLGEDVPMSLYVHIPFCENICYFCACNKIVTRDKSKAQVYVDYLHQEISLLRERMGVSREITALHLGGGTPTFLSDGEITELIFHISKNFNLSASEKREFSIEVDPRTVSNETLGLLKGLGFNRLSLGVQDFDESVQEAVNRRQSFSKVKKLSESAREYGFNSLSYDLIYGLPMQTESSFAETVYKVVELGPDRVAVYNYAHLPQRFPQQRSIDRMQLPEAGEKLRMMCEAAKILQEGGYRYIGMDHFVKVGEELDLAANDGRLHRSFQGYSVSHAPETIALGVSGISSLNNCYAQNHKTLPEYYAALDAGELPIAIGLTLNEDDYIRRQIINDLICTLSLDIAAIEKTYDIDFDGYFADVLDGLKDAEDDGLLERTPSHIKVSELGRLFLRNICMLFDKYLTQSEATFSKTL